jgi:DNA gyrase subunit A
MMVSDGGQVIRVPVGGIRMASRATKGVTIFSTAKDERVVSVDRINEPEAEDELEAVAQLDPFTWPGSRVPHQMEPQFVSRSASS